MKNTFKTLVISAFAIQVIILLSHYYWGAIYTNEEMELLAWHGFGAKFDIYGPTLYMLLGGYFVVTIGLITFMPWAKIAFLLITIASIIITSLMGITITETIGNTLGSILSLIDGAILTMLYFTSVSNEFTKSA